MRRGIKYGPAVLLGPFSLEPFRTLKELRCTLKLIVKLIVNEGANLVIILVAISMYLISSRYGEIIIFFQTTMETEKVWIKTEEEEEEMGEEVTQHFSEERPCVESVESER